MKPPKISIIIVTWNGLNHLKKYLPSVFNTDYSDFEVIIADNASDDGTIKWINEHYPHSKVASLKKNYGYAGGNNRAAKIADGEILLFLNNDVEVTPNWLNSISNGFNQPDTAVIQPKIRSVENRRKFEYAGAAGGYIDWLGYPFCRGRIFNATEFDEGQYDDKKNIFWASGAAFAIRKSVFDELGGFDSDFEFHMEEIDLCWRALKSGYNIFYEPESVVYHLGGGSMPENTPRKTFYNFRNSLLMLLKNLDKFIVVKIFARLVLDGLSGIRFLIHGQPAHTIAIIKAHFSFYSRMIPCLSKRRSYLVNNKKLMSLQLIYSHLIPVTYFLQKRRTFQDLDF